MPKAKQTASLLKDWDGFLESPVPRADRFEQGKKVREKCGRDAHGKWTRADRRNDPLELLLSQDEGRVEHLVPYRYGRMIQSPFAFYRGAALIMASDLGQLPRTPLNVQLCGDCHLSNFGIFATPERNVIFDLNDFDETLPGPFEWDVKRLAASFAIAADANGFKESVGERCVEALGRVYRKKMQEFSQMGTLDVWYHRVPWEYLVERIKKPGQKRVAKESLEKLAEKRSHVGALNKLTEVVNGRRRIKDDPPLLYHTDMATEEALRTTLKSYASSLWQSRQRLLQRYHFVDIAAKVVGVGSVGTAAGIILLKGEGAEDDYIFLQIKQAVKSVLEPFLGRSQFEHPGERIVNGQRVLQAASDMFLGWTSGPLRDFYLRQLMDVKISVPVDELDAVTLEQYAEVCGYALARAHAKTGDSAVLSGYLGKSDEFDEALVKFARAYKNQNEQDHAALVKAVKSGRVKAIKVD